MFTVASYSCMHACYYIHGLHRITHVKPHASVTNVIYDWHAAQPKIQHLNML